MSSRSLKFADYVRMAALGVLAMLILVYPLGWGYKKFEQWLRAEARWACSGEYREIEIAIAHDLPHCVEKWIGAGGDPNHRQGALLLAATGPKGGNEVLEALLKAGADPNLRADPAYDSALMNAAMWVRLDSVMLLMKYGADPCLKIANGESALDIVGQAGGHEGSIIRLLEQSCPGLKRSKP